MNIYNHMSEYIKTGLFDLVLYGRIKPDTDMRLNTIIDRIDDNFTNEELIMYLKIFHSITLE